MLFVPRRTHPHRELLGSRPNPRNSRGEWAGIPELTESQSRHRDTQMLKLNDEIKERRKGGEH